MSRDWCGLLWLYSDTQAVIASSAASNVSKVLT